MQERQARPVRGNLRSRARSSKENGGSLFRRDRAPRRLQAVRRGGREIVQPARPSRLLRPDPAVRRERSCVFTMIFYSPLVSTGGRARCPRRPASFAAYFEKVPYGA